MITYSSKKSDINRRALDAAFAEYFPLMIADIFFFALSVYFIIIGLLVDKEALTYYGLPLSVLVIFIIIGYFILYLKLKKNMNAYFEKTSSDEVIEYQLIKADDKFFVVCIPTKAVLEFSRADIKYIRRIGISVVVKLKDKRIACFPKTDEIYDLLK